MAILQDDVEQVRRLADLVSIAGEHIALKKVGRRWMGICPFHAESSPSFSINGEEGLYYCFGCQQSGDVITFVREVEHLDFVGAVELLAAKTGTELHYDNTAVSNDRKHRSVLTEAMVRAVDWYHERLLTAPDAKAARSYLRERGYDGALVRQFKLGWAPTDWDELSRSLKLPEAVLKETGLGFVNKRGRQQDAFRGRVLFPIFDPANAPVALGGRILPGSDGPKYKNSSETPLYSKSRTLYALNWAKADIVSSGEVIVCEGYTDVIGFFQAGVPRAVATCGTALTEEHVRQLKNFAPRVVLAYDADGAGQAAAARFYEWERKLGIDIAVAVFPSGTDPADAARKNPELLREAVAKARPFLEFRLERLFESSNLRTVEGRARAAEQSVEMIREHPRDFVRDQYLMLVADRCRLPVEQLRQAMASPGGRVERARPRESIDVRSRARSADAPQRVEWQALRVAVHQPEDVARFLERVAPAEGGVPLEDVLFDDQRARSAFVALVESATLREAIDTAEPEASELLARLSVEDVEGNAQEEFIRLIDRAANRALRELEREARVKPDRFAEVGPSIAWLKLTIEQLREFNTTVDAATALLGWLVSQIELVE